MIEPPDLGWAQNALEDRLHFFFQHHLLGSCRKIMELHPKYDSDIETDDPIYTCRECVKRFMIHVIRLSGPRMVTLISVSVCAQLCPVLCNTLDCSPDSSVHGIFQASILERVAISSSRGSA